MTVKHTDIEKTLTLEKIKKDIEKRAQKGMRVFLASVQLPANNDVQMRESLTELEALIRTLGDHTQGTLIQKEPNRFQPLLWVPEKQKRLETMCLH